MAYDENKSVDMEIFKNQDEDVDEKEVRLSRRQAAIIERAKMGEKITTGKLQRVYKIGFEDAFKDIVSLIENGFLRKDGTYIDPDEKNLSDDMSAHPDSDPRTDKGEPQAGVDEALLKRGNRAEDRSDRLLVEERHRAILDIISEKGSITTSMIQLKFGVGYDTAKRDLRLLEEKGLLKRTHGGAVPVKQIGFRPEGIHALSSKDRCAVIDEKYMKVARAAVKLIEHNDVVFITAASVGYLMAKVIREGGIEDKFCSVVTNSSTVAEELRGVKSVRVFVTGGEMKENGNFYDDFALSMIERMRFDKYFITSASCSASFGLSIQGENSIIVSKAVLKNSRRVIGLYPSAKIGSDSIIQICPIDKVDVLITDDGISEETLAEFREIGVDAVIA